jgi:hypothetical protein
MSDVVDIAGPLGRNPEVLSSALTEARQGSDSWKFQCIGITFDSHGHLVTGCVEDGLSGQTATVVLADARTFEVLDSYLLASAPQLLSAAYGISTTRTALPSPGPNDHPLVEGGSEESSNSKPPVYATTCQSHPGTHAERSHADWQDGSGCDRRRGRTRQACV